MSEGRRARADQRARRINAAVALLDGGATVAEAVAQVADEFELSDRQARRYVELARESGEVAVPEAAVVFTVRLPGGLVARLRRHAGETGRTLSGLVAEAIEQLLERDGKGRGGG
jgi:DNA-binding transcriptional regulator LsrR (DeoR family)